MSPKNVFYAQSGGVTAVINASACGVIETCRRNIHPGTPLNPKEKDLDKWIKRAEPFN